MNTYPPPTNQDPQPAGIFSYLPEDYTKPKLPISGNSLADDTAAMVKEIFTTEVLERRRTVDDHLKAFKLSLGKDINDPLPACFVAWKKEIFPEWEEVPEEGAFHVESCTRSDEASMLQTIHANKHRDFLTQELITTGNHMNDLLKACLDYLQEKDYLKHTLREQNMQLLRVEVRTRTTDAISRELQSLPAEIDRFAEEIRILMKNISTSLDSYVLKRTGSTGMKRGAGALIRRVNSPVEPPIEEEQSPGWPDFLSFAQMDLISQLAVFLFPSQEMEFTGPKSILLNSQNLHRIAANEF